MAGHLVEYIACVDLGGTYLKRALVSVDEAGWDVLGESFAKTRMSDVQAAAIVDDLVQELEAALGIADRSKAQVTGLGVCSPGPFDWQKGISLMTHKLKAIANINLKDGIRQRVPGTEAMPIKFFPDSYAFAAGEKKFGQAKFFDRCIFLTLGTGLGSAFSVGEEIFLKRSDISPSGSLWEAPYRDGIAEDHLSRKAIINRYLCLIEDKDNVQIDVDVVAARARAGDKAAIRTFNEFGKDAGAILSLYGRSFRPGCIVIGGGISSAFPLFENAMQETLRFLPGLELVTASALGDLGPLLGIAVKFREGYSR